MEKEIDPVVYGWCRDHGCSVLDPEARAEFSIWCSEVDAMKEIDVNDDGDYKLVYGYDVAESRWLRDVELENEILREEFYDSYTEFLNGPYIEWCEDADEMYQPIDDPSQQKRTAMSPKGSPTIRTERRNQWLR